MADQLKLDISKDVVNKKLTITRAFNAPLEQVWKAWTDKHLLDQWWAPKPYVARTKSMDFENGGSWVYEMQCRHEPKIWTIVEFKAIEKFKSFEGLTFFCDQDGVKQSDIPNMIWKNNFIATPTGTTVIVDITVPTEAELDMIIAKGFESGFSSALQNLEETLAQNDQQVIVH